jgi:DNA-binding CsgD family transcriptional regulator
VNAGEHRLQADLCFLGEDLPGVRRHLEQAFRLHREAGERRAAARDAADMADLHNTMLGNRSAGLGWVQRGRRLLESEGRCVEAGYLELSIIACEAPDVDELLAAADRALALALEFGDADLEVRALADSGYALVVQGRLAEGFARLDEAMATLSAGEVANVGVAGTSYCALLSACDRAGDVRRAEEWSRVIAETVLEPLGGQPRVLHAHCRLAYGSVLCTVGRWPEGESAMLELLEPGMPSIGHRADAAARLAGLRLLQGRFEEARRLLGMTLDRPFSAEPLARLHLLVGEADLAAAVARREVDAVPGDRLRTGALLGLLVEAELARDAPSAAADAAARLREVAASSDDPALRADADLAHARLAAARLDPATALDHYRSALGHLCEARPLVCATIGLEMAQVLAEAGDSAAAVDEARRALASFDRLGAKLLADRTDALLRSLGARSRSVGRVQATALSELTARERDVLALLREGLTNAEIAARLFISAKTAEHHVGHVLAKLGVRSRAEAAAVAAATP